ncbi:MAG: neutral/alkaline non-lysosomal ceramidase N-terminal domain-containing protein [Verrucomicrobia bacterium]|nr:neutral/alkaline non-lysosomal ceramidase N-terminal domain-containing protein [Verrucomicrobiota bacterium]
MKLSHGPGKDGFHSVPDSTLRWEEQYQGRGGTRPYQFMVRAHGSKAVEASAEPDRAALPRSRFSIDATAQQRRPTKVWFTALPKSLCLAFCCLLSLSSAAQGADQVAFQAGAAKADITPGYPIRLSGYGNRRAESEGVAQKIWAKALAIGSDAQGASVVVTVENCGVSARSVDEVAARLLKKAGIARERFAVCATHSHTAPCLTGVAPNLFSQDIPKEHQATIDRYTRELTDSIEQVALTALANRKPSYLAWGQGKAGFAQNRRTKGGPVDHALPMLRVTDITGNVRAILANYACHCTTLTGEFNQLHGDWAGLAQEYIERDHPGAVALIAIGCGADANPQPRGKLENAVQHGEEIAREVKRLASNPLTPIRQAPAGRVKRFELAFQPLFTREQWEERAKKSGIVGYHAKVNLARLDRGETLPTRLPYIVQTWTFGDQLAMVFLAGEVVVDYSIRLKNEFDSTRLWINAYANDAPCYIPSKRILREGGYEAEDSLWYYDRPARLAPETEDLIDHTVHELLPKDFIADPRKAEFPPAKSPEESLASIQTKAGLKVELVAAEPLVASPVAIDFGPDGKLWVVEMRDFPMGLDGNWKPGGRVKFLEDLDGDGKYEKATVLLDGVPFPTGVLAWKRGALVCAAPDILYAEDTNGDGQADVVQKLFTGFATENYQARVNGLSLGLDNWIYGANGLIGGVIRGVGRLGIGANESPAEPINIRGRDFRINPETGVFETAAGLSQQSRVRDDWGNWFGCDNSTLLWHFPLPDHYARRNPHVAGTSSRVPVAGGPDPNQLFPISRTLRRFNDPGHANRVTSVCGVGIYRDEFLGAEFYGNVFVCEPVHNLVHRLVLAEDGVTFKALRAPGEQQAEFLASTDNWFRPVQARTGPDGALWVVDMYRFVVEHPRWITPERLKELDLRAGVDLGRIYRVYPRGKTPAPIRDLTKLSTQELARSLDHPNGTERDRIHQELLRLKDTGAVRVLRDLARTSVRPACRIQALGVLDGLKAIDSEALTVAFHDVNPEVRAQAVRLSERFLANPAGSGPPDVQSSMRDPKIAEALLELVRDPRLRVRYQLALSLGQWDDARAAEALSELLIRDASDPWLRAAVLSSASRQALALVQKIIGAPVLRQLPAEFVGDLATTAIASDDQVALREILTRLMTILEPAREAWPFLVTAKLLDALDGRGVTLESFSESLRPGLSEAALRLGRILDQARETAASEAAPESSRAAALKLLCRMADRGSADRMALKKLLETPLTASLTHAVLDALERSRDSRIGDELLADWAHYPPSLRSAILEKLLRRKEWTETLVDRIKSGLVIWSELSAEQRQRLMRNAPSFQDRLQAIVGGLGRNATQGRADVVAQFEAALNLTGDRAHGRELFQTFCANCHRFHNEGLSVGPNLQGLTDKSARFLLTAILDPNAAVEDRYTSYSVELRDGRSLSGIVTEETPASLGLLNAGGTRETILRSAIREIRASRLSLMPEGLEAQWIAQDLADLIAYVQKGPGATQDAPASAERPSPANAAPSK